MHDDDTEQVAEGNGPLPLDPDLDLDLVGDQAQRPFAERQRAGNFPSWRVLAAIAVGGFFGGLARYELGLAFPARHGTFPTATFAINISGSFILALLIVLVLEVWPPTTYIRPLIGTGFCGAYTTFSTWMVGVDQLFSDGRATTALWYLFGSLVAGLGATSLGLTSGRAVVAHRRRVHASVGRETVEPGVRESRESRETIVHKPVETAEEGRA